MFFGQNIAITVNSGVVIKTAKPVKTTVLFLNRSPKTPLGISEKNCANIKIDSSSAN